MTPLVEDLRKWATIQPVPKIAWEGLDSTKQRQLAKDYVFGAVKASGEVASVVESTLEVEAVPMGEYTGPAFGAIRNPDDWVIVRMSIMALPSAGVTWDG